MDKIESLKLNQELQPLQARIERVKAKRLDLEQELRQTEAELERLEAERKRYNALQDACTALTRLAEFEAKDLFWSEFPEVTSPDESVARVQRLPALFQKQVEAKLERKNELQEQIEQCSLELFNLDGDVYEAYLREQKRRDEFVIEREVAFFPMRAAVMPWSKESESERYFRRSVLITLLLCFLLGGIVPLIQIPQPDRSIEAIEMPERLVTLVKKEPVIPEEPPPPPKPPEEEKKPDEVKAEKKKLEPDQVEKTARKKVQNSGVLAFKDSFKDLIEEVPVSQQKAKVRISKKAPSPAGNPQTRRSLVAMQATGTSGGINAAALSTNLGSGGEGGNSEQIGGVAFTRVESAVADLSEQKSQTTRNRPGSARSDEEIQIVFDRYKATLYRIYNKELRKDPTLRGNIVLRISIEPGGEVSSCSVESTDLASKELVDKIVARVKKFNFGPKKDVAKTTILYPIDFLPAG